MNIDKLLASIELHEGLELKPYTDTTGHLTIGYGTNLSAGITIAEAIFLLNDRLNSTVLLCEAQNWWPNVKDDDVRSRAMIEIVYNMGIEKIEEFKNALGFLIKNNYIACAQEFMDSLWAKQVGDRAIELTQMMATGQDPT